MDLYSNPSKSLLLISGEKS